MIQSYGVHGERQAWLGLDPGVTTGWVVLGEDARIIATGTADVAALRKTIDHLIRGLHRTGYCVEVVIEEMPRAGGLGPLARTLDDVWREIYEVVDATYELHYVLVSPSRWKPSRVARLTEVPSGITVHQADALRMTRYEISRRRNT